MHFINQRCSSNCNLLNICRGPTGHAHLTHAHASALLSNSHDWVSFLRMATPRTPALAVRDGARPVPPGRPSLSRIPKLVPPVKGGGGRYCASV